jgi:tetraprenyl-beta-curcumene synthase
MENWRERALMIPNEPTRQDALNTLKEERLNAEGAALFATLPPHRDRRLLRLLVAFQVLLDFLDTVTERIVSDPLANGTQLHRALVEALNPELPISDYYRHHPYKDDGGYLRALVETCREQSASLPSYWRVRSLVLRGAERGAAVQVLNHDPDPARRAKTLAQWAKQEFPYEHRISWWELGAAASSSLGIHALLSLAADPQCAQSDAEALDAAYMPWICAASTMLDSYVDQAEDLKNANHSYVAHYPDSQSAVRGVRRLIRRACTEARSLPNGHAHAVIATGMVAMYLSKQSAYDHTTRTASTSLAKAGGSLAKLLRPVMRAWRRVRTPE